jgi:short-subunit dehydrogenase
MKKAVVVGCSTGIGRELARSLARDGWTLGLAGRSRPGMESLRAECGGGAVVKELDLSDADVAARRFSELLSELGGCDLVVLNSGVGFGNEALEWEKERQTIAVNVTGVARLAGESFKYFLRRGGGHLVGISSISALRGYAHAPAYNASKAFLSSYLQGLRVLAHQRSAPITVTDIQPGFVETPMTQGNPRMFWVATAEEAARQIHRAIRLRKDHAYVTRRWRLVAWLIKIVPEFIYRRV